MAFRLLFVPSAISQEHYADCIAFRYLFLVGDSSEIVIDGDYWDVQSRSSISSSSDAVPQHTSNKDDGKMV